MENETIDLTANNELEHLTKRANNDKSTTNEKNNNISKDGKSSLPRKVVFIKSRFPHILQNPTGMALMPMIPNPIIPLQLQSSINPYQQMPLWTQNISNSNDLATKMDNKQYETRDHGKAAHNLYYKHVSNSGINHWRPALVLNHEKSHNLYKQPTANIQNNSTSMLQFVPKYSSNFMPIENAYKQSSLNANSLSTIQQSQSVSQSPSKNVPRTPQKNNSILHTPNSGKKRTALDTSQNYTIDDKLGFTSSISMTIIEIALRYCEKVEFNITPDFAQLFFLRYGQLSDANFSDAGTPYGMNPNNSNQHPAILDSAFFTPIGDAININSPTFSFNDHDIDKGERSESNGNSSGHLTNNGNTNPSTIDTNLFSSNANSMRHYDNHYKINSNDSEQSQHSTMDFLTMSHENTRTASDNFETSIHKYLFKTEDNSEIYIKNIQIDDNNHVYDNNNNNRNNSISIENTNDMNQEKTKNNDLSLQHNISNNSHNNHNHPDNNHNNNHNGNSNDLTQNINVNINTNNSDQELYNQVIDTIFNHLTPFINEIESLLPTIQVNINKFIEIIGMMKGLTDAICHVIILTNQQIPHCDLTLMKQLFEKNVLKLWSKLLLVSPNEIRNICKSFLIDAAMNVFYDKSTVLDGKWLQYFSDQDNEVKKLRNNDQQKNFEINCANFVRSQLSYNQSNSVTASCPPSKRRKKTSRHHLFRKDGTARKRQQNPNQNRICKRMWQDDGTTRGCGENSHPRGVCACWKNRGFKKEDVKNGNIQKWLETTYKHKFKM